MADDSAAARPVHHGNGLRQFTLKNRREGSRAGIRPAARVPRDDEGDRYSLRSTPGGWQGPGTQSEGRPEAVECLLARPRRFNAVHPGVCDELPQMLMAVTADDDEHVVPGPFLPKCLDGFA